MRHLGYLASSMVLVAFLLIGCAGNRQTGAGFASSGGGAGSGTSGGTSGGTSVVGLRVVAPPAGLREVPADPGARGDREAW